MFNASKYIRTTKRKRRLSVCTIYNANDFIDKPDSILCIGYQFSTAKSNILLHGSMRSNEYLSLLTDLYLKREYCTCAIERCEHDA